MSVVVLKKIDESIYCRFFAFFILYYHSIRSFINAHSVLYISINKSNLMTFLKHQEIFLIAVDGGSVDCRFVVLALLNGMFLGLIFQLATST